MPQWPWKHKAGTERKTSVGDVTVPWAAGEHAGTCLGHFLSYLSSPSAPTVGEPWGESEQDQEPKPELAFD